MSGTRNWWMKILFLAVVSAGNSAMAIASSSRDIANLLSGNTLFVGNKFGPTSVYFDPAGTFRQTGGDGVSEGTWRTTDDSVCATTRPKSDGKRYPEFCLKIQGRKIGEAWNGVDSKNGEIIFRLMPGNSTTLK